ncbi:MAG: Ni/Fe-hydrogenase cytochrome b subunit [Anaerolineaceae bacterium]|nr:Ni/Fe-hydrogenase cytochrome b subunit [Anaerolineaceae bacterium]
MATTTIKSSKQATLPVGSIILWIILLIGVWAAIVRYSQGLGSTNLADSRPWGLWIAFDVMAGVALAAGGFTLAAIVYIFRMKRFYPLIRPTLLTAYLGYLLAAGSILFDLGRPDRFYHPFFYWNHHSVMFEIAWSVILYLSILTVENSQLVLEKFRLHALLRIVRKITIPVVIAGIIISTAHQSSLGGLFVLVPNQTHPLWYTPILPVLFYISAISVGLAMVIVESTLSAKAFDRPVESHLLSEIGSWLPTMLGLYLLVNLGNLAVSSKLGFIFEGSLASFMYLAEIIIGVVAPLILLSFASIRNDSARLFQSALLVVFGVIFNRFNVLVWGQNGAFYVPNWVEFAVTAGLISLGTLLYIFAVKNLPVYTDHTPEPEQISEEAPLPAAG